MSYKIGKLWMVVINRHIRYLKRKPTPAQIKRIARQHEKLKITIA